MSFHLTVTTASTPGAVAIIQLRGHNIAEVLSQVTDQSDWPLQRLRLVRFNNDDAGMAVCFRQDWAQLMPHGGPRVVRRLVDALTALCGSYEPQPPPREIYPEAASDLEADMLVALARAASPVAIDLLLAQPAAWRAWLGDRGTEGSRDQGTKGAIDSGLRTQDSGPRPPDPGLESAITQLETRNSKLETLLAPPSVVVVGRPNVGKSTLTNRMLGRAVSVVADLPGTTRDWVAGLAEITGAAPAEPADPHRAIAVRWLDTPGLRRSDDPIEQQAIALAAHVIASADVLLALRNPRIDWPKPGDLPRPPDVWVINKCDLPDAAPATGAGGSGDAPLAISARTGEGLAALEQAILDRLGLARLNGDEPWAFSPALRDRLARRDLNGLAAYIG